MKVSHSMCGLHEDIDIIFGQVRHFGWHVDLHLCTKSCL